MSGRAKLIRLKVVKALRRAIYKPVELYPSRPLIHVVVRLDRPLRAILLADTGVLDSH
jgi:hypothetical protein